MQKRTHIKKFAIRLLGISHTNGLLDDRKILAILKVLPKNNNTLLILQQYYSLVVRSKIKEQMIISSDHEVDKESIQKIVTHFEKKFNRKLRIVTKIDPMLIAGICIQVGDKIFEQSIRATLATLNSLR